MDLMKLGAELIQSKLGGDVSGDGIVSALSGLLGGGDGKDLDLSGLVSGMMSEGGGIGDIIGSWLGDGDNSPISGSQIQSLLGSDKISAFAGMLGIDTDSAADSLAEAVPQMVDKGSSGGSLLDSVGGISGAIDLAKKLF